MVQCKETFIEEELFYRILDKFSNKKEGYIEYKKALKVLYMAIKIKQVPGKEKEQMSEVGEAKPKDGYSVASIGELSKGPELISDPKKFDRSNMWYYTQLNTKTNKNRLSTIKEVIYPKENETDQSIGSKAKEGFNYKRN